MEIWGSFAPAYGRLYFMAEDGLYCLGDKKAAFKGPAPGAATATAKTASGKAPAKASAGNDVPPATASAARTAARNDLMDISLLF